MAVISRGIRNAFRNATRTISIVFILSLSIGLSLIMLVANQAVENKIQTTLKAIGNTVTIAPIGFVTGSSANNALSNDQLKKVRRLQHVTDVTATLSDHLQTEGTTSQPQADGDGSVHTEGQSGSAATNLKSPIKINSANGTTQTGGFVISGSGKLPKLPDNFSLPVAIVGSSNPSKAQSVGATSLKILEGTALDGDKDEDTAMVSKSMADKNNLKLGSTFTAYGKPLKVAAVFESNTESGNSYIVVSLPTLQRLTNQKGVITNAVATADSLTNLSSVTTAIKQALGSAADITSNIDEANKALEPLSAVKSISLYGLVGAVAAGAAIILLTMIMIVRERRREIGVLKAVGLSNVRIMGQFISEAMTFTSLATIVGLGIGVVGAGPITATLVSNSGHSGAAGGGPQPFLNPNLAHVKDVQAAIDWTIIVYGFGAAVLIALVGSALASYFISKIRPAEVLRSE
ncbi:MAG TPA: FtsX-like permease family protein [Candidatus Saccharimonadales bacterium]|nr:FtsX-like permease family protein [Candidatus Saccharimonadales bacterium]